MKRHDPRENTFGTDVKWSETLKRRAKAGVREQFSKELIKRASYRPFVSQELYHSPIFVDRPGASTLTFPPGGENIAICFSDAGARTDYCVLAVDGVADLHFGSAVDAYQQVPLYRYEKGDHRVDNVTDWAADQFREHYRSVPLKSARLITKESIFDYVYAVLYDPKYRQKYKLNLRRSFPRIPFYADFWRWADWGRQLIELHTGYESVERWPLQRRDIPMDGGEPVKAGRTKSLLVALESAKPSAKPEAVAPKAILKADKSSGRILVDSQTTLYGVPEEAWKYRLGNRPALEWILDQYKERMPKDPTIREKFDTYRFADYKEEVIELLMRVTRVSIETQKLTNEMIKVAR